MTDRIGKLLERVAREIVHCNCAEQGPALKRCEHVSLASALEERLAPLLRAGQAMRERLGCIPTFSEDRAAIHDYDAALATLEGRE